MKRPRTLALTNSIALIGAMEITIASDLATPSSANRSAEDVSVTEEFNDNGSPSLAVEWVA